MSVSHGSPHPPEMGTKFKVLSYEELGEADDDNSRDEIDEGSEDKLKEDAEDAIEDSCVGSGE